MADSISCSDRGPQVTVFAWDKILRPVMAFDITGQVVWAASYAPFGAFEEIRADTFSLESQHLRFPGQWFQPETGLHQNWHRDYDPKTGRYLQADPLGLVDGPSVYGYARQRPVALSDPRGLAVCAGACVGAGIAITVRVCAPHAARAIRQLGRLIAQGVNAVVQSVGCRGDDRHDCEDEKSVIAMRKIAI
ncbi:MAG: RHS repeat-associated core domain-containing protein [Pseudomonadota bacterium]